MAADTSINLEVTDCPDALAAIRLADLNGWRAATVGGRHLAGPAEEFARLEAAGIAFAYLSEHRGRVVTVPVS
jgi:hypothetical protein